MTLGENLLTLIVVYWGRNLVFLFVLKETFSWKHIKTLILLFKRFRIKTTKKK